MPAKWGGDRLPLVYWRTVVPDDSDLLRRVRAGDQMRAANSDITLDRLAGAQLERIAARPPRPELIARMSPDGEAVAEFQTAPESRPILNELGDAKDAQSAGEVQGWAELKPAQKLLVRENDFKIPQVKVKNAGQDPVLLPAGSAFLGGAQNRMLLEPAVLPAGAERTLGVFCVEAGRWDETQAHFRSVGRVPSLFLLRVLEAAAGRYSEHSTVHAQHQELQVYAWETVLAGLTLAGEVNPTMDLMRFTRNVPRRFADEILPDDSTSRSDGEAGPWGLFHADSASGIAGCALYPNAEFSADAIFALQSDSAWRGNLLANGRGAREYYRIFDESKRLAIRCLPDGSPLRDLRRKPVLFEYTDADLENSFRPPMESPPPPEPLSFAHEAAIQDWPEMAGYLRECRVELRKQAAPPGASRVRPGEKAPPDIHMLRFVHPAKSLMGSGLLIGGRPAYLEATAFRPHAN
ncbi:MAG: hypothetical protein NXI24_10060 [bacterium]|nr:hypothetical protein [bacterium]